MQMVSHVIITWSGKLRLTLSLMCIYGGEQVHRVGSTTISKGLSDYSYLIIKVCKQLNVVHHFKQGNASYLDRVSMF